MVLQSHVYIDITQAPTTTNRSVGCHSLIRMRHCADKSSKIESFEGLANAVAIAATRICSDDQKMQRLFHILLREKLRSAQLSFR
jgi:hypothetical protein